MDSKMLRDALIVALRSANAPVSTDEVAAMMPGRLERRDEVCRLWCDFPISHEFSRVIECHTTWHVVQFPRTSRDVHRHLRALERSGRIERRRGLSGIRLAYWAYVDDGSGEEITDLEARWGLDLRHDRAHDRDGRMR